MPPATPVVPLTALVPAPRPTAPAFAVIEVVEPRRLRQMRMMLPPQPGLSPPATQFAPSPEKPLAPPPPLAVSEYPGARTIVCASIIRTPPPPPLLPAAQLFVPT